MTGVKGDTEPDYHRGNINITPESIGALSLGGGVVNGETQFLSNVYFKAHIRAIYSMIWKQLHAYDDSRDSIIWEEPITIQDKNGNRVGYISMRYNTEGGADLSLGADHGNILTNNNIYIVGDRVATYNYLENFLKLTGGTVKGDVIFDGCSISGCYEINAGKYIECISGSFRGQSRMRLMADGGVLVLNSF